MESKDVRSLRIGILGGMGPLAGVLLQRLIIEATPASQDQDHLEVVCFTDPKIPDRTNSLLKDGGGSFVRGIVASLKVLEPAGVDLVAIPCHTAHARFKEIQAASTLPIINMVELTKETLKDHSGKVGVLATDGSIREAIYQSTGNCEILEPGRKEQMKVMELAYRIKAGKVLDKIEIGQVLESLKNLGANGLLLACTEFSLYYDTFGASGLKIFDPLRILAQYLVNLSKSKSEGWNLRLKSNKISLNEGDYPTAIRH